MKCNSVAKQKQLCELNIRPVQSFRLSRHIRRRISCNLLGSGHTFKSVRIFAEPKRDSLWIVCELLWKRIEWARPGRIRIETCCCLPRAVRTTKFDPALAVRPLVAGGGAQPFLLALCWAAFDRTTCWSWRRRGACWSWLVGRDAKDDGAKVAKDPGYSVDQLDPGALHNQKNSPNLTIGVQGPLSQF